jgi:hypothetical protein
LERTAEKRKANRLLLRRPAGKKPLGRPRRGIMKAIRIYLGEIG